REAMLRELKAGVMEESSAPPKLLGEVDEAYWDPGLVPKTTVVYPSLGCEIIEPHLLSRDGRRVNVLQPGREYTYVYHVRFDNAAVAVRFGMMLKTVRGIELGGAVSAPESAPHDFFAAGQVVRVEFSFRATLAAGAYFLNAGVVGLVGEEETYLSRSVDVAMFRVLREQDSTATGMVDFGVVAEVARVEAVAPAVQAE